VYEIDFETLGTSELIRGFIGDQDSRSLEVEALASILDVLEEAGQSEWEPHGFIELAAFPTKSTSAEAMCLMIKCGLHDDYKGYLYFDSHGAVPRFLNEASRTSGLACYLRSPPRSVVGKFLVFDSY
jgi:hypothetical protein